MKHMKDQSPLFADEQILWDKKSTMSIASFALCFLNYKVRNIYLDIENLPLYPDIFNEIA